MPALKQADVVISGGASHIVSLCAAVQALRNYRSFNRIGGTSAGGVVALMEAFGIPYSKQVKLIHTMVTKNGIMDPHPKAWVNGAVTQWRRIPQMTQRVIGKDTVLGESKIPVFVIVCDAYEGRPRMLSSWGTPDVLVSEAAAATSAIYPLADMQTIPSSGTGNRLYFDGGFAQNFAMEAFDDMPEVETVGIRMDTSTVTVIPVRSVKDRLIAIARNMLWSSSNAYLSVKPHARMVTIVSPYDGLSFDQSQKEFLDRITIGSRAVHALTWGE
jgi:predicted acylesterase/phospholipase RssA